MPCAFTTGMPPIQHILQEILQNPSIISHPRGESALAALHEFELSDLQAVAEPRRSEIIENNEGFLRLMQALQDQNKMPCK